MAETPLHILLVEDNPGDARLLQELMAEAPMIPFKLTHADRLSTGLERLAEGGIDVVLLDLSLPDSRGPDTLARLLAQAPGLPVVVLTGLEDEGLGVQLVYAGAQDYLVKGQVTGSLLRRSLRHAIERNRAEAEILRRNRELLPLHHASVAITASLSLSRVLDTVTREMTHLLGVEGCVISVWSPGDETVLTLAESGPTTWKQQRALAKSYCLAGLPLTQQVLVERQVQQMTLSQPQLDPAEFAYMQAAGIKTRLRLPLEFQDRVIGLVEIEERQVERTFTDQELALAQLLANQAAGAIENARLHAETAGRAEQLAVLHELDQVISASLRIDDVYRALAHHLSHLLPYDRMSITLLEGDSLRVTYTTQQDGAKLPAGMLLPLKTSAVGRVATKGQPLLRHHITAEMRFAEDEQLVAEGIQSSLILPLRIKGKIMGTWNLGSQRLGTYGPNDLAIAQSLADPLAIAIENARLYEQARQEIAERQLAEEALKRERNFTAAILDTAAALIVALDPQGRVIHFNQACEQATGYTLAEVKGAYVWDLPVLPEEEAAPLRIVFEELRAGLFPNKYETYWLTKDGRRRLIAWSNTARLDPAGTVEYIIATGIDITERKQLEEQLRQAQKMEAIGRLASGVDHDFNNLLLIITGYSELLLRRQLAEDNPARRYVEEIKQAGEQAAALTRRLLAFSRQQMLQMGLLDLNTIVAEVEKILPQLIGDNRIGVTTMLEPGLGAVKADPGQMEQVIVELILNARDAMPQGGQLAIETANLELDAAYARQHGGMKAGPYVMLAVSDTGLGMDQATLSHLFEPFFTTKERGKGAGLGLATVYGIVKQSGGDIRVSSAVGQGTTFKVYLPRVEEADPTLEPGTAQSQVLRGAETILLVEDKTDVRALLRAILVENGYTVLEASNGHEALVISERHPGPIHLLLTNLVMPEMSGRELAEYLALLRPGLKVLYMSGYTDEAMVRQGMSSQGLAFLQEPFSLDTLAHKVHEALNVGQV